MTPVIDTNYRRHSPNRNPEGAVGLKLEILLIKFRLSRRDYFSKPENN